MKSKSETFVCEYCKIGIPHLLITLDKNGEIHVHAPWNNKYLMNEFLEAIYAEQRNYNKLTKNKKN